MATSSVLLRHGSPEDRKDEERDWKNHQRRITTQGEHVLQFPTGVIRVRCGNQYEIFKYFFGRSLYLLLTEFELRTLSYRRSFHPFDLRVVLTNA